MNSQPMPPQEPDFTAFSHEDDSLSAKFNLLDKAAKKNDRWWFIALLIIGMVYVGYERWESAKERDNLRAEITDVRTAQLMFLTTKNDTMTTALLNNTRALEANTLILNRIENRKDQ